MPSGVLYPILHRMEEAGWIASEWADPEGSYPRRRVYRVTDEGRYEMSEFVARSRW